MRYGILHCSLSSPVDDHFSFRDVEIMTTAFACPTCGKFIESLVWPWWANLERFGHCDCGYAGPLKVTKDMPVVETPVSV